MIIKLRTRVAIKSDTKVPLLLFQQTSDLDTLLCRQDLDRLQKLDEDESERDVREQSVHMEDFFEVGGPVCRPQASFVSARSQPAGTDDDVFLRPPLWEDITSSIQKLDPENADMLGSQPHVKMETDEVTPPPVLSPVEIKTEPLPPPPTLHLLEGPATNPSAQTFSSAHPNPPSVQHVASGNATSPLYGSMTRLMYISPLTPPISDPGSPIGAGPPRRTPPPPYPQPPILNPAHRIQPPSMTTKFNRRNNPELEKRRVHHCDFIGEYSRFSFPSSSSFIVGPLYKRL
ncbi:hypothetical protein EAI_03841 [Harpegnathos saltator]|uniref:Uncharacterized protein n=1 Tax=Harpegnathos saltator TaxID=610380 RepID=E2BZ19_HARSA|nr:hypothetical protein EAI_03841 [Harpegnathos saltator]